MDCLERGTGERGSAEQASPASLTLNVRDFHYLVENLANVVAATTAIHNTARASEVCHVVRPPPPEYQPTKSSRNSMNAASDAVIRSNADRRKCIR